MRLFVVRGDLAFTLLRPVSEDLWRWRGGAPVTAPWQSIELTVSEGAEADFIGVDCMELISGTDGFIVSEFARSELDSLLSPAGEFWPVTVVGRPYWWFNCLACVEVLDRDRTDADWSVVRGDWGSFSWITATRRLAFHRGKVASAPALFRIPEYPQGVLFGREDLTRAVEQAELTGFKFDPVWSEAEGGVLDPPGIAMAGIFDEERATAVERRRASAISILERRRGPER